MPVNRRQLVLLTVPACAVALLFVIHEGPVIPTYRFPMGLENEYTWLTSDRLIQPVSDTEVRILEIRPKRQIQNIKADAFFWLGGISASPDGKFIAWRDRNWTYSQPLDDLTKPLLPRRQDTDWYTASNTQWLADGKHYVTFFQPYGGLVASIAASDSDHSQLIRLPDEARFDSLGRGIRILRDTPDKRIAFLREADFPVRKGKIQIHSLSLTGDVTTLEPEIPLGGSVESGDQVALTPAGDKLVWVVRRVTKPTFTARTLGRLSGPPAEQEYAVCSTDLAGHSANVIVRFPLYGQGGICGFVKVCPDGKLIALRVGSELCIYPLH